MQRIIPVVWHDGTAEDAARFYAGLFPAARLGTLTRYGKVGFAQHGQPEGRVMTADVEIDGFRLSGMNAGAAFRPTPAVSYFVVLEDAAQVDRVWAGLTAGGAALMPLDAYDWSPRYGWANDRFGVSWQVALGRRADIGRAVAPFLLFTGAVAGRAEEAVAHYTSVFPDSAVTGVLRHAAGGAETAGTVKHAQFTLFGETFMAMDSALGHEFGFTEGNSFMVLCRDQDEVDRTATALSAEPGAEQCGWLKDRFGVSWQITPEALLTMIADPDRARADRVFAAVMEMRRLDLATLQRAYAG